MIPSWFSLGSANQDAEYTLDHIPFRKMWEDAPLWFPLLLSKTFFVGRVDSALNNGLGEELKKFWFGRKAA
jgi:hypothetical protein